MAEELNSFPKLKVTPPLLLKNLGCDDLRLVYLSKGTAKMGTAREWFHKCLN